LEGEKEGYYRGRAEKKKKKTRAVTGNLASKRPCRREAFERLSGKGKKTR